MLSSCVNVLLGIMLDKPLWIFKEQIHTTKLNFLS